MMKIYHLSQPQKILGVGLLAMTAGISALLVLAARESASQMTANENIIVTREVKLQLPNSVTNTDAVLQQKKSEPSQQQDAIQPTSQIATSGSWKMGDVKSPTPKITLSEQITAYAIVEIEQIPATLPIEGQQIVLPMLNGQKVIANVQSVVTNPNGDYTWSGHVQGYGDDYPVVMTYGNRSIFATITTPEGSYTMEALDGLGWLYKNPAEIELSAPGAKDFLEVNAIQ